MSAGRSARASGQLLAPAAFSLTCPGCLSPCTDFHAALLPRTTSPPPRRTVGQALLPFSQEDVFLPRATPRLLKELNFSRFICRGNQANHSFLLFIHLFFCLLSGSFIRRRIFTKPTYCFRLCAPETLDDAEGLVGPPCPPRPQIAASCLSNDLITNTVCERPHQEERGSQGCATRSKKHSARWRLAERATENDSGGVTGECEPGVWKAERDLKGYV